MSLPDVVALLWSYIYLVVKADIEALKASDKADADCVFATWQDAVCHIIQVICSTQATLMHYGFCQHNSSITGTWQNCNTGLTQATHV